MVDSSYPSTGALTHASFFSGVGGLDLGLERAGWRTVSLSEIDPYACAVLAERWPGVPQLGDIVALAQSESRSAADRGRGSGRHSPEDLQLGSGPLRVRDGGEHLVPADERRGGSPGSPGHPDWRTATLWSGGFPCQDLSVAGKRRGFGIQHDGRKQELGLRPDKPEHPGGQRAGDTIGPVGTDRGTRSGLAFAFLDLLDATISMGRGPRVVLLENVPGLMSSHGGRDMAALLGALADLGYGVAYRMLDAKFLGVPQRRRRVFIVGVRCDPDDPSGRVAALRAAEVLAVGTRCVRHPPAGIEARKELAAGTGSGTSLTGGGYDAVGSGRVWGSDGPSPALRNQDRWGGPEAPAVLTDTPPDTGRMREIDGLARRLDDRKVMAFAQNQREEIRDLRGIAGAVKPPGTHEQTHVFTKGRRAQSTEDNETWVEGEVTPTLNSFDVGAARATVTIVQSLDQKAGGVDDNEAQAGHLTIGPSGAEDPLLPVGLDSHRYRCCGNGVVSNVAEWIGWRLRSLLEVPA